MLINGVLMMNGNQQIGSLRCSGVPPVQPWGETLSGDQYYYLSPDPSVIKIGDIARSLSYTCRYNGHVKRFYSVAEHCIHMALVADPDIALLALCHDAHEAYVGDVASPQKAAMIVYDQGDGAHSAIEYRAKKAVEIALGIDKLWNPDRRARVKQLDTRICLDERLVLKHPTSHDWGLDWLEPLGVAQQIANFGWRDLQAVEDMWMNLYLNLCRASDLPIPFTPR
jgi:uncharacterized protein